MKFAIVVMFKPTPLSLTYPSLGPGYVASYIREYSDHEPVIIDTAVEDPIRRIRQEKPDVIGISSSTLEFSETIDLSFKIALNTDDIPVVVGGPHVSALPHTLQKAFDIGIIGEGEQTCLELLDCLEKHGMKPEKMKKINGLAFHDGAEIKVTRPRSLIIPLDKIPYPAYDLFNMDYYLRKQDHFPRKNGKGISMMTSRGCPYRCVFCGSSHFWRSMRFHSAERVVDEMRFLVDKYSVEYINIFDDIFTINIERLRSICKMIKDEGIHERVTFGVQARANLVNDEICKVLKEMNVYYLGFGLESASKKVLTFLKKGTVTVEDNRKAVEISKKHGFTVGSGFMVGNPDETEDDMMDTLNFLKETPMDSCAIYITAPLPGTELWEIAKERGIVSDKMDWSRINQFFSGNNVILSDMDRDKFDKLFSELNKACVMSKMKSNLSHPLSMLKYVLKNPLAVSKYFKQVVWG